MLRFPVVRGRLLAGHCVLAVLCAALGGISLYLLLENTSGLLSAAGLAVLTAVSILVPAVVYRIYLLLTAEYDILPAGALRFALEPARKLSRSKMIEEIRSGGNISQSLSQ